NSTPIEPRGGSEGTEKVRTPVGFPPEPRLTPRTPVVGRTGAFRVFTIVALPTMRPRSLCTEARRTASGNDCSGVSARAPAAEPPVPAAALPRTARPKPGAAAGRPRQARPKARARRADDQDRKRARRPSAREDDDDPRHGSKRCSGL